MNTLKAIKTKYIGATDHKPSRIVASAEPHNRNRVTLSYDHELDTDGNHSRAALALCDKMLWTNPLARGHLDNGTNVYVMLDKGRATYTKASIVN